MLVYYSKEQVPKLSAPNEIISNIIHSDTYGQPQCTRVLGNEKGFSLIEAILQNLPWLSLCCWVARQLRVTAPETEGVWSSTGGE